MSAKVLAGILGTEGKVGRDFVPLIPDLPTINAQQEQARATAGNIANLPAGEQLASGLNKFNLDEIQKMYQAAIPGYNEMMTTGSNQINSMLKGELPKDVQDQIQRSTGYKSFAGGYGGSGMSGASEAEKIGISSLAMIQQGLSASERWLQSSASRLPHLADASAMFISPAQQIALATSERNNQFNYKLMKAKYAASPNAMDNAITGVTDWAENIMASAATMGISGGMGGGGGMGGMGSMMGGGGGSSAPTSYFGQNAGFTSGNAGDSYGAGSILDYYPTGTI